jgi:hypothetical protein
VKGTFEQHLNEGEERSQPSDQVELRDDGVEIDLPSRGKIENALKYLKNNKVAGADSIEEVISLAWTSEKLPESWTKRVLSLSRYLPADRCVQSLRQSIIRPFITLRQRGFSLVQLYQAGFQINDKPTLRSVLNP